MGLIRVGQEQSHLGLKLRVVRERALGAWGLL